MVRPYFSAGLLIRASALKRVCFRSHRGDAAGVGHDHVYHEVLLEIIIILKAIVLPIDSDNYIIQG